METKESETIAQLLKQYGYGPIQFVGTDNAFYERHLIFDNVLELTAQCGTSDSTRLDAPVTLAQKAHLAHLSPETVQASPLAGEPITARLTCAPGNTVPIGGLTVVAASIGFAARPSGTENISKIDAEFNARLDAYIQSTLRRPTPEQAMNGCEPPCIASCTHGSSIRNLC